MLDSSNIFKQLQNAKLRQTTATLRQSNAAMGKPEITCEWIQWAWNPKYIYSNPPQEEKRDFPVSLFQWDCFLFCWGLQESRYLISGEISIYGWSNPHCSNTTGISFNPIGSWVNTMDFLSRSLGKSSSHSRNVKSPKMQEADSVCLLDGVQSTTTPRVFRTLVLLLEEFKK